MSLQRPGGLLLLSADTSLHQQVAAASSWLGRVHGVADSIEALVALVESARPCAVIIDHDDPRCVAALTAIRPHVAAAGATSIVVVRGEVDHVQLGAHVVSELAALPDVLRAVGRPPPADAAQCTLADLVVASVLAGPVDAAVKRAEAQLARGLGVDRCVIVRGADERRDEAKHSRAAMACDATLVLAGSGGATCTSYLGVALDDRSGEPGCIGFVVQRPHVFSDADRTLARGIAARIGHELAWRGSTERSSDELDRLATTAGVDELTGVWNRAALSRLTTMYLSTSLRFKQALGVIVIDIVDLGGLNTRRGREVGDAVLQRVAEVARSQTRTEDVVGRWDPGAVVMILQGVSVEGTHRAAARITAGLDQRLGELPAGAAIQTRFGVCIAYPNEDAASLLDRASRLAKEQAPGLSTLPAETGEGVGTTLGGTYRLLDQIGQGAMGLVYRAEDLALERPVAIKMLRPDLVEDPEIVEQLRGEASLLARLQHPNLVQVYSFAHGGGDAYIAMELVEGECLLQAVERHCHEGTTLPLADVLAITREIASALDALHEYGVVHRDVKPANVIRDPFRARSVLVDVGIARRYGQAVETAGTPGYVAPEVIRGEDATPRSDVYGLAATVYSLLTLASPWPDEGRVAILTRQATGEDPPLMSTWRPELAPADELMRGALSNDVQARPTSAGAFARDLTLALSEIVPAPRDKTTGSIARVILPRRVQAAQARTRGIVFRSVARAIGVREAERVRDRLVSDEPDLACALSEAAPLDWQPTALLTRLLELSPVLAERDGETFARDIARATVRASFRRFFPASPATLMPERTLSAIRTIWSRYHTWGTVACMPLRAGEVVVRISDTPRVTDLCAFGSGLLEEMVVLSGGHAAHVEHERCEARGDTVCLYRISWERQI